MSRDGRQIVTELSQSNSDLLLWTSNIVAAYLNKNQVDLRQIPHVLETVYAKLAALGGDVAATNAFVLNQLSGQHDAAQAAVSVDKSVTPDFIICLEDGVRLKTMKRYLFRKYRLTPDQYRVKWGLPSDYPMVAPNYAAKRSRLAKNMGLGRRGKSVKRAKPRRDSR